jgi:hypothetical protein
VSLRPANRKVPDAGGGVEAGGRSSNCGDVGGGRSGAVCMADRQWRPDPALRLQMQMQRALPAAADEDYMEERLRAKGRGVR